MCAQKILPRIAFTGSRAITWFKGNFDLDLGFGWQAAGLVAWEAAHGDAERPALVAGSLPPLKEAYQTTDLGDAEIQQPIYEQIAAALAPHVDVLLCETMATLSQTWAAATAASATGKPFWVCAHPTG